MFLSRFWGQWSLGKSTLFNFCCWTLPVSSGKVWLLGERCNQLFSLKTETIAGLSRSKWGCLMICRENILVAISRRKKRVPRHLASYKKSFKQSLAKIGNGLENHIATAVEFLSGRQRQSFESVDGNAETSRTLASRWTYCCLGSKTSQALMTLTRIVCGLRYLQRSHPPYGEDASEIWEIAIDKRKTWTHRPRPQPRRKSPNDKYQTTINCLRKDKIQKPVKCKVRNRRILAVRHCSQEGISFHNRACSILDTKGVG